MQSPLFNCCLTDGLITDVGLVGRVRHHKTACHAEVLSFILFVIVTVAARNGVRGGTNARRSRIRSNAGRKSLLLYMYKYRA